MSNFMQEIDSIYNILVVTSLVLGIIVSLIAIIRFGGDSNKNTGWVYLISLFGAMIIAFFSLLVLQDSIFDFDSYKYYAIISLFIFSPIFAYNIYAKTCQYHSVLKYGLLTILFIFAVISIVHIYINLFI